MIFNMMPYGGRSLRALAAQVNVVENGYLNGAYALFTMNGRYVIAKGKSGANVYFIDMKTGNTGTFSLSSTSSIIERIQQVEGGLLFSSSYSSGDQVVFANAQDMTLTRVWYSSSYEVSAFAPVQGGALIIAEDGVYLYQAGATTAGKISSLTGITRVTPVSGGCFLSGSDTEAFFYTDAAKSVAAPANRVSNAVAVAVGDLALYSCFSSSKYGIWLFDPSTGESARLTDKEYYYGFTRALPVSGGYLVFGSRGFIFFDPQARAATLLGANYGEAVRAGEYVLAFDSHFYLYDEQSRSLGPSLGSAGASFSSGSVNFFRREIPGVGYMLTSNATPKIALFRYSSQTMEFIENSKIMFNGILAPGGCLLVRYGSSSTDYISLVFFDDATQSLTDISASLRGQSITWGVGEGYGYMLAGAGVLALYDTQEHTLTQIYDGYSQYGGFMPMGADMAFCARESSSDKWRPLFFDGRRKVVIDLGMALRAMADNLGAACPQNVYLPVSAAL